MKLLQYRLKMSQYGVVVFFMLSFWNRRGSAILKRQNLTSITLIRL